MSIQHYSQYKDIFEDYLGQCLNSYDFPAIKIKQAIEYSTLLGGKRIRPILVYLCGELFDIKLEPLHIVATTLEFIHCYSLIHDDLPAMDDDDYRRGKPSCHRQFDEATAILAGDGLQSLAFELVLTLQNHIMPQQVIAIANEINRACGPYGMISGQSLDITELDSSATIDERRLNQIHLLKTGKLFQAAINSVLLIDNQKTAQAQTAYTNLRNYAHHLGLAFQIQDDYLDSYADINILGKKQRSDISNDKATYAKLYSKQQLFNLVNLHYQSALDSITPFHQKAKNLIELTLTLKNRSAENNIVS